MPTFSELFDVVVSNDLLNPGEFDGVLNRSVDIFEAIRAGGVDEARLAALIDVVLGQNVRPNVIHQIAASLLGQGGTVWTSNFDELIEIAAYEVGVVLHLVLDDKDVECSCKLGHLVKPGGTASGGRFRDYAKPAGTAWAARLKSDSSSADLAIYGYSNQDAGLREPLLAAIGSAQSVTWFTLESGVGVIGASADPGTNLGIEIIPDADVWTAFKTWSAAHGLEPLQTVDAIARMMMRESTPTKISQVRAQVDQLVAVVRRDPTYLHRLGWREFEEFTARVLNDLGYETEVTQGSRDGGVDIYATKDDPLGERTLVLVQCKHYSLEKKVGVEEVAALAGVVRARDATGGAMVTSSLFTSGAIDLADSLSHNMTLRNYVSINEWIRQTAP